MAKIINDNGITVLENEDSNFYGIVCEWLYKNDYLIDEWERLSYLVETMTGDASTPFNTIAEMIKYIPGIENCEEETVVMGVYGKSIDYHILGWNYEDDAELWNGILQKHFPNYTCVCA